jgi:hypothetical protein
MKTSVGYFDTHRCLPGRGLQASIAEVCVGVVRRSSPMGRRRVLHRLPDSGYLAERLRELALEAELAVNSLRLSGGASNADGLAELRGTCLELARMALLTLLAAAHEQASAPELPARKERT